MITEEDQRVPPRRKNTTQADPDATPLKADEIAHVNTPPTEPATPPDVSADNLAAASLAGLFGDMKALAARVEALHRWANPADGPSLDDNLNNLGRRLDAAERAHQTDSVQVARQIDELTEAVQLAHRVLSTQGAISDAPEPPAILDAIRGVMGDVQGVGKHGEMDPAARMGRYKYQRYDDLKRELGAAFRAHGVFLQSTTTGLVNERVGQAGAMSRVVVSVTYRFTSLVDGSELTFDSHGESIDKSDKATSKAMTMALKTALVQAFMLAAEDIEDPDAVRPREDDAQLRREPHSTQADVAAAPSSPPAAEPDPWDQGPPKDTRTPQEQAQAAANKLGQAGMTMDAWSKISEAARQLGLYEVPIRTSDGAEMALKHYLVAVGKTL